MPRARKINRPPLSDLAAQYVRMSTEHQQYSIDNQVDAIREYAERKGLRLVRTYSDPGRSGLSLRNRPGLRRLLSDVEIGEAPFRKLLVYDVSRWGRFQDPDEAAAYEFHCRSRGVEVIYCVESFDSAAGVVNGLLKNLKRSAAAEYSSDLSKRIIRAKMKVAGLGYWVGSPAPYGYQRWAVAPDGRRVKLQAGDMKHAVNWRTVLEPGPPEEIALVQRIFRLFVDHRRTLTEVVDALNGEGWPTRTGAPWRLATVRHILLNDVYGGTARYNQTSKPLLGEKIYKPEGEWLRVPNAFPAIISASTMEKAQARFRRTTPRPSEMTDDEMIAALAALLKRHGKLTARILREDTSTPSCDAYSNRFGGLSVAFPLAGYTTYRIDNALAHRRKMRAHRTELAGHLRLGLESLGVATTGASPQRFAAGGASIATTASRPTQRATHKEFWDVRFPHQPTHIVVAARLSADVSRALDYWIIPRDEFSSDHVSVGPGRKSARFAMCANSVDEAVEKLARMVA